MLKRFAFGAGAIVALVLTAAQQPSALAGVQPGLWKSASSRREKRRSVVRGGGSHWPSSSIAAKPARERPSAITATRPSSNIARGSKGFGRSQFKVITPRSVRIETQGISDQLPLQLCASGTPDRGVPRAGDGCAPLRRRLTILS